MSSRNRTSATNGSQRSRLTTCFLALVSQPRASQPCHHRSRKQLTTYVESLSTSNGPSKARTASSTAWISIRWFVVWGDPPESCLPSWVAQAHPPGPGLPEQAPSVQTERAATGSGIGGGDWLVGSNSPGGQLTCAQRRDAAAPVSVISSPGEIR